MTHLLWFCTGYPSPPLVEELRPADPGLLSPFYAKNAAFDGSAQRSAQILTLFMVNVRSREGNEYPGGISEWVVKVGHDFEGDGMAEEAESDSATEGQGGGGERYVTEVGHTDGKM